MSHDVIVDVEGLTCSRARSPFRAAGSCDCFVVACGVIRRVLELRPQRCAGRSHRAFPFALLQASLEKCSGRSRNNLL